MSGISYTTFERDFRLEQRLGKGNYATVTRVLHLLDQRSYAHKCIELNSLEEYSQAFNEIETNRCIDDERIVKINYYYTRENKKSGKYELGILMELCSSSLTDSIKARRRKGDFFSKGELVLFLSTMLPFFAKMQRKGYLHRDIKPDNILLTKNVFNRTEYKVGDFGFSIRLNAYSTQNIAGTMEYVSPKLLVKFKDNKVIVPGHNFRDDVYSFGKTLYELMTLDLSAPVDQKKLLQASSRYGPEYGGLLALMMREVESERPDFIYLENFAVKEGLIGEEDSELGKDNYLSISTVNASPKNRLSLAKNRSKDKLASDVGKTRKKECEVEGDAAKLESTTAKTNLKVSMVSEEVVKRKVINYNEDVHSLALFDSILLIGSEGKLGLMLLANEKIIKLKYDAGGRPLSCIRVDPMKRYVFFGTLEGRLYTIEIRDIKSIIVQNNELLKKRSEVELPFSQLKHRVVETGLGISTLDCHYLDDAKEPTFVLGHYTGEITCINAERKFTQASFSRAPVTQIAVHEGCIYSTTTDGVFRRELNLQSAQWKEGEGRNTRFVVHEKNACFKYHEMLVGFQMIESCRLNEGIKKEGNKLLAIVISYDGIAHLISRSFRTTRMVTLSECSILAATFSSNPLTDLGVTGYVVDAEGEIFNEEGRLIDKSEQKKVGCVAGVAGQLYLGSFNKTLTVITRREAVRIE